MLNICQWKRLLLSYCAYRSVIFRKWILIEFKQSVNEFTAGKRQKFYYYRFCLSGLRRAIQMQVNKRNSGDSVMTACTLHTSQTVWSIFGLDCNFMVCVCHARPRTVSYLFDLQLPNNTKQYPIQYSLFSSAKTVCSHIFVTLFTVSISYSSPHESDVERVDERFEKWREQRRKFICFYSPCETIFFFPLFFLCQFSSSIHVEHIWHLKIFEKLLLSVFIVWFACLSLLFI